MNGVLLVGGEQIVSSFRNRKVKIETAENCRDWCQSTKGCGAWVFHKGRAKGAVEYCMLLKTIDCSRLDLNIEGNVNMNAD